jgi:hypothetical protein
METIQKTKVYVYFGTYGTHKHEVLVIKTESLHSGMGNQVMLDPHHAEFGRKLLDHLSKYLTEQYEVLYIANPFK